jgi:hypothetical protein
MHSIVVCTPSALTLRTPKSQLGGIRRRQRWRFQLVHHHRHHRHLRHKSRRNLLILSKNFVLKRRHADCYRHAKSISTSSSSSCLSVPLLAGAVFAAVSLALVSATAAAAGFEVLGALVVAAAVVVVAVVDDARGAVVDVVVAAVAAAGAAAVVAVVVGFALTGVLAGVDAAV